MSFCLRLNPLNPLARRNIYKTVQTARRYKHTDIHLTSLSTAIQNRDTDALRGILCGDISNTHTVDKHYSHLLEAWLSPLARENDDDAQIDDIAVELAARGQSRPLLSAMKVALQRNNPARVLKLFEELQQRQRQCSSSSSSSSNHTTPTPTPISSRLLVCVVAAHSLTHSLQGARSALALARPGYTFSSGIVARDTGLSGAALQLAQEYVENVRWAHVLVDKQTVLTSLGQAAQDGMRRYILEVYDALTAQENTLLDDDEVYAAFLRALAHTHKRTSPPLPTGVLDRPLDALGHHSLQAVLEGELVHRSSAQRVTTILRHMSRSGILPHEDTAAALIARLIDARSRDGMQVFDSVQTMYTAHDIPTPTKICNALLAGLTRVGMSDVAIHVFHQMNSPTIVSYNILIRAAVLRNDTQTTIHLIRQLKENNIPPDAHTFSMLLIYLRKQTHPDAIGVVVRTMAECDVDADVHIYSNMLDILAKEGEMDEALCLLDRMEEEGMSTTSVTYTSLISAHLARSPDGLAEAQSLMTRMKRRGLAPTQALFQYAITASLANNHPFAPWVLLEQMAHEPNVHITKNTLYLLMKGFYDARRFDDCRRLIDFMQKNQRYIKNTSNTHDDDAFGRIMVKVRRKLTEKGL